MSMGEDQPAAAAVAGAGPLVWLVPGSSREAGSFRTRMVCVPAAGGTVANFHGWASVLGRQDIAVAAADWSREPPSRDRGDGVLARSRALAEAAKHVPPPWVLVGHSFGGLIAYEAARYLEFTGRPGPSRLVLCATRPPHQPEGDVLAGASDAEIAETLRLIGGQTSPALAHPLLRRLLVARIRSEIDLAAAYRHTHERRLRCPALVYGGSEDQIVPGSALACWPELLAECQVRMVPGGHSFPLEDVPRFLRQLLADTGLAG